MAPDIGIVLPANVFALASSVFDCFVIVERDEQITLPRAARVGDFAVDPGMGARPSSFVIAWQGADR